MSRNRLRSLGLVNTANPINWAHRLNHGRVEWWKILPNSGWSGGATLYGLCRKNNGTLNGNASPPVGSNVKWVDSKGLAGISRALSFDGTSGYVSTSANFLSSAVSFTIMAWIYSVATQNNYAGIVEQSSTGTNRAGLYLGGPSVGDSTSLVTFLANGSNTFAFTATGTIALNKWYHTALVYDGALSGNANVVSLYVNGQKQSLTFSGTLPASTSSIANPVFIGRNNVNAVGFSGLITEPTIYNRDLPAKEIYLAYFWSQRGYPGVLNYLSPVSYGFLGTANSGLLMRRRRAYA